MAVNREVFQEAIVKIGRVTKVVKRCEEDTDLQL